MSRWQTLIEARLRLQISQAEAAERLGVEVATYQRWEWGKRKPQPRHMRELCALFDLQLVCDEQEARLGARPVPSDAEATVSVRLAGFSGDLVSLVQEREMPALRATQLAAHLWSLVHGTGVSGEAKRAAIRQAIEEYDRMNRNDTHNQITRREAMRRLATLPLVTLGLALPGWEIAPTRYGEVLAHSPAGLEACWELYERGGASELLLGFQCVSQYLAVLERIGQTSPQHREEALQLAAQYALLKTIFGWHCAGTAATIQYAQNALTLSTETGALALQLSASSKLAWVHFYGGNAQQALVAAQEGQAMLERSERQAKGDLLPASIRGGTYSTLAMMQARNGQPSAQALAQAMERDPGTEVHAYLDFTRTSMLLEAGYTLYSQDNHRQAREMLEKRVNSETLAPRMPGVTEAGRMETVNLLALSFLRAKDRDLERAIHYWQAVVEGAKALRSEYLFVQAATTCEQLALAWPEEARVRELRGQLVHWEEV
jgi:transcriptional regulator with XRE-family HTH domain